MLQQKLAQLKQILASFPDVVIAYSGGVDSTFLLKVATDVLGKKAVGVIGVSPSLAQAELQEALRIAREFNWTVVTIPTHEMEDPNYVQNPQNRCYFCKKELFGELFDFARSRGFHVIADGTNVDDLGDTRPGLKAAAEFDVRSPLKEAGLHKQEIRELSRLMGLPTWNKPEMACLSSRFPTGVPITEAKLRQVEAAESILRTLGFRQFRVRHHETLARIEVAPEEWTRWLDEALRETVHREFRALGYRHVTLDVRPYQRKLTPIQIVGHRQDESH